MRTDEGVQATDEIKKEKQRGETSQSFESCIVAMLETKK